MHAMLTTGLAVRLDRAEIVLGTFCSSLYQEFPKPVAAIHSKNSGLESAPWSVKQLRDDNSAVTGYFILCVKAAKPREEAAFGRCHQYLGSTKCPGLSIAERHFELLCKWIKMQRSSKFKTPAWPAHELGLTHVSGGWEWFCGRNISLGPFMWWSPWSFLQLCQQYLP